MHLSMNECSLDQMLNQFNCEETFEEEKYINANYIKGLHPSNSTFIATQAPIENSLPEFFAMIWQSNCSTIISLTSLVENQKVKMIPFWPENPKKKLIIDDFVISIEEEISHQDNLITRIFLINKMGDSGDCRTVKQIHYTGWPDNDVPSHPSPLYQIYNLQTLFENDSPLKGPAIVHCSAGIGRTASYVGFV